ncbi:hypothetical protein D3C87_1373150 [compost metagenome]
MPGQRQQLACSLGRVVEHQIELANGFFSGLLSALLQCSLSLHIEDAKTQYYREQSTGEGDRNLGAAFAALGV